MTLEDALMKIEQLRKRLRKAQQTAAIQCSDCKGYWISLAEGRDCVGACQNRIELKAQNDNNR